MTQAELKKKLKILKRTLKGTAGDSTNFESKIKQKMEFSDQVSLELDKHTTEYSKMEDDANST